jgi:HJR/Mrr/RecB family endonuclease
MLGVSQSASNEEIRAAFRRLSLQVHPDRGGSAALFRHVEEAYETLRDPDRRADYDRRLRNGTSTATDPDSGWVRVDDPAPGPSSSGGTTPPPRQPPPPPGTHWQPPGGQATGPPPPFTPPGFAWTASESRATAESPATGHHNIGDIFSRHPVGCVALLGIGVMIAGTLLRAASLNTLGFLVLICAVIAMFGTRRATWKYNALRTGTGLVDTMSGTEFEMLLQELFSTKGYRVQRIGGRGDFGADLIVEDDRGRYVVQAKRWSSAVHHDAVQQVVAAVAHYRAVGSIVVTTSFFTEHARRLAQSNGVVLWDRSVLLRELASMRNLPAPNPARHFFASLCCGITVCLGALATVLAFGHSTGSRSRRSTRRRR